MAVIAALGAGAIGYLSGSFGTIALVLALTPLLVIALSVEPWVLVGGAVATPWLARLFTTTGLAPEALEFADFGIVIVALGAAMMSWLASDRDLPAAHGQIVRAIAAFAGAIVISAVVNVTAIERLVVGLLLTLEPFLLICAIVIAPPPSSGRRTLWRLMAGIAFLQVPIAISQSLSSTDPDVVKGTLLEAGAGHHVMAGGLVVGLFAAIGVLKSRFAIAVLAIGVLIIGALADAKQVMLVAPIAFVGAAILVGTSGNGALNRRRIGQAILFTLASILVLLTLAPIDSTIDTLNRTRDTGGGKPALTAALADDLITSPLQGAFGYGPGETVSRFGYLTTILESSSLAARQVGLGPGKLTLFYDDLVSSSGFVADSSFSSGQSSLLGIAGDYGFLGLAAVGAVLLRIMNTLRRQGTRLAQSALAAWLMAIPLAYVFDWLEQPPFMLMIALLTGLALTEPRTRATEDQPREALSRPIRDQITSNAALVVALVAISVASAAWAAFNAVDVDIATARIRAIDAEPVPEFLTSSERVDGLDANSRVLQLEDVARSATFQERREAIAERSSHSFSITIEAGYTLIEVIGDADEIETLARDYRAAFLDVFHGLRQESMVAQFEKIDSLQAELDGRAIGGEAEDVVSDEPRYQSLEQTRRDLFIFRAAENRAVVADGDPTLAVVPRDPLARSLITAAIIGALWAVGFIAVRSLLVDKITTRDEVVAVCPEGTPVQQTKTPVSSGNPEVQILALRIASACQPRHRGVDHMIVVDAPGVSTEEAERLCAVLESTVDSRDPLLGVRFGLIPEADEELIGTVIAVRAGHLDGPQVTEATQTASRTGLTVLGVLLYHSIQAPMGNSRKQGVNA